MIDRKAFDVIAQTYGLGQAEQCAAGDCTHTHQAPPAPMTDLRCPEGEAGMGKLLGRTRPVFYTPGVIELACGNCARAFRRAGLDCSRVLHRYNLLGELLATEIIPPPL